LEIEFYFFIYFYKNYFGLMIHVAGLTG